MEQKRRHIMSKRKRNYSNPEMPNDVNLESLEEVSMVEDIPVKVKVFNCTKLNLREKPDLRSEALMVLDAGTMLKFLHKTNTEWTKVQTNAGVVGYVLSYFVKEV
jgi:uncharacterized protein YgiM (DUF1202 family)